MGNGILCAIIETVGPIVETVRFETKYAIEKATAKLKELENKTPNNEAESETTEATAQ